MVGIRVTAREQYLATTNLDRCYHLWQTLRGGICDFDDCDLELAARLGWVGDAGLDLSDMLSAANEWILEHGGTWAQLRSMATAVFFDLRADDVIEAAAYDRRSWDEIVEDTQFASGECEVCRLGFNADTNEHRFVAELVAVGRISWEEVAAKAYAAKRSQFCE